LPQTPTRPAVKRDCRTLLTRDDPSEQEAERAAMVVRKEAAKSEAMAKQGQGGAKKPSARMFVKQRQEKAQGVQQ